MAEVDNTFVDVLRHLQVFFHHNKLNYCIVGGLAVCFRGEVRATVDIDIAVQVDLGTEAEVVRLLLDEFSMRYADTKEFAQEHKVVFLDVEGVPVDILLGFSALDAQTIENATKILIEPDLTLPVCSAQDLIVHKFLAGTEKDFADIRSILIRSRSHIDISEIESVLRQAQEILDQRDLLRELRKQLEKVEWFN